MNAQIFFFQLPKLNKYCLGAELAAYAAGDKKAQNGSSVGLHTIPLHAATATECDEKKKQKTKRACQLLKFSIHALDREINIL